MKISKIISVLVVLLLLAFAFPFARRAYAMSQVTMVNRTQVTLNLYISYDGGQSFVFGCGPVMPLGRFTNSSGMFCTSSTQPGPQIWRAVGDNGQSIQRAVNVADGASPTWTVCYANDNSGPCNDSNNE
jgi:hypothetical protein